jgi:ankyrin repeat protein
MHKKITFLMLIVFSITQISSADISSFSKNEKNQKNQNLSFPTIFINTPQEKTPLIIACENGLIEVAKLLLARGDKINQTPYHHRTALSFACEKGQIETIKFLLANGADPEIAELQTAKTPLIFASENGQLETTQILLEHDAKIEAHHNDGRTALIFACKKGHTKVAKLLLDHGANIKAHHNDGRDAFIFACENNQLETAKLLLAYGANIDAKAVDGNTAFTNPKISLTLKTMLALEKIDRITFLENFKNKKSFLNHLHILKRICIINTQDEDNDTILLRLIMSPDLDANLPEINAILENPNVDANLRNQLDETPLHAILMRGPKYAEIAKKLLEHGAKINDKSLITKQNKVIKENRGELAQVYSWADCAEKTELLKLFREKLLSEGKLTEYLQAYSKELALEITEIVTFLIQTNSITEITESFIQKLKNPNLQPLDINLKISRKLRTMGV